MSETLLALLAFSPIVIAAILLVGLNWPAKKAMPVAFALTVGIALTVLGYVRYTCTCFNIPRLWHYSIGSLDCVWRYLFIKHFKTHWSHHYYSQRVYGYFR